MREVIVHHHIFKNAGSTMDAVLKRQFGAAMLSLEGAPASGVVTPKELLDFIKAHPGARVVTSHQARLVTEPDSTVIIRPIILLRHPIDRVQSIYEFLRRSPLTPSPPSQAAHSMALKEFVEWQLDTRHPVARNFQARFFAGRNVNKRQVECDDGEFDTAMARFISLSVFGLVEQFDESLRRFALAYGHLGLTFAAQPPENINPDRLDHLDARVDDIRARLGSATYAALTAANRYDTALYEFAVERFARGF